MWTHNLPPYSRHEKLRDNMNSNHTPELYVFAVNIKSRFGWSDQVNQSVHSQYSSKHFGHDYYKHICGGSVLSITRGLTAAHCVRIGVSNYGWINFESWRWKSSIPTFEPLLEPSTTQMGPQHQRYSYAILGRTIQVWFNRATHCDSSTRNARWIRPYVYAMLLDGVILGRSVTLEKIQAFWESWLFHSATTKSAIGQTITTAMSPQTCCALVWMWFMLWR